MEDKKVIRGTFPVRWHKDGQDGKDGTNVWMKYAKTLDKGTYPSTMYDTFSSDMNYIGIGNGRGAEPTDPSKYAWKKIKGEDGTSFTAKGNAIAHYANKADFEAATKTAGLYLYDDSAGAKLVQWNGSEPTEMSVATGDAYTTSDMHLWVRDETKWVDLGMIQGPAGTPGDDGESYWIVPSSETVPLNSSGYPISASISATAWCKIGKTNAEQITKKEEKYKDYTLSVAAHYADGTRSEVNLMDDNGKVTLSLDSDRVVQGVTMKLKKGETTLLDIRNLVPSYNGKNGIDGKNAIRLDLDNENDTMLYGSDGQRVSGDIITNAQLYDGATRVESGVDYNVDSSEGCEYSHQPNSSQFTVTGMTEAVGWLRIKATYNGEDYLATLTLKKIVGQCKYDIVTSASAITKNANTGELSPATVTAYIRKTDPSGKVTTTEGTASGTANKIDDKSLQVYNGVNWSDVSGTSINTSGYDLMLRISHGTYVYDQETLPLIISGKNGTNGDDAVSYWLDCSHMAVPCTSDGKARSDVSITIKAWQKIGDNEPVQLDIPRCVYYKIIYKDYDTNGLNYEHGYCSGETTIIPDTSRVLKSVSITLKISGKIIQTITLLPVLDGPMGSAGYDYIPDVLGLWDSTHAYKWDNIKREGFLYLSNGSYDLYYVKNRMTTVDAGTEPTNDQYFVKASKWYTIYTEALYTPNASIGGFSLSDKMFISAEISYTMTYRGTSSAIYYRGLFNSSTAYKKDDVVYYDGSYYIYTYPYSSTTGNPPGNSKWKELYESRKTDKYIIDMVRDYSTTSPESKTLYGYYDSSTKDRPFVYYNGKFWTTKKYGKATDSPSETSTYWRELFDAEKLMLGITGISNGNSFEYSENSIYTRSISRYMLNGKEGTSIMLQPDDTVWTYDMTGKQTMGIPYSKHIEIDPADGKMRFYNTNGTQNGEVSGETVSNIDDLLGSSATGEFSNESKSVHSAGNGIIGRRETIEEPIGRNIILSGNGVLNISSTLKLQGSQWNTNNPAGGGATSGSVGPLPEGASVQGLSGKLYTNTVSAFLLVQKQSGSTWVNVTTASSQNSTSDTSLSVTTTSSRTVNLSEGTYRIVLRCEISVYANNLYGVSVNATSVSASVSSFVNLHRFFGNGFAFGSSTNNFFAAINEGTNMHTKMLTGLGKFGYELDATYGMQVRRGTSSTSCLQGLVPPVVFFAYIQFTDKTTNGCKVISYNTLGHTSGEDYKPSVSATAKNEREYYVTLTLPTVLKGKLSTSNCFVSVTGINSANVKPTVRPFTTSDNSIKIDMADDESNNFGNFQIKIEYFG